MLVSGWKNGPFHKRRAVALGVRVGREFAARFFDKECDVVLVEIDGETFPVKLTKTFWKTCPELRSPAIGSWNRYVAGHITLRRPTARRRAPWSPADTPSVR